MSVLTRNNIVTNGLVLYLDAANKISYPGSGTTWQDLSGRGNNGTLVNGPTFSTDRGGSIQFDGSDDYGNVGDFDYGRGGLSVCAWFKFNVYSNGGYKSGIVSKWQTGAGTNNEFYLGSEGNGGSSPGSPSFAIQGSNNIIYSVWDTNIIQSINVWYYQVGTFDGNIIKLYLNGNLIKTSSSIPVSSVKTLTSQPIGLAAFGSGFSYKSYLTLPDVKLYNRAISASEIQQNYNATKVRFGLT